MKKLIQEQINEIRSKYLITTVTNDKNIHFKNLAKIVELKGGKIKEGEVYINSNTKMKFIDQLGNEFNMTPKAVKIGQWSPYEVGKVYNPEYHIQELQKIALARGGKIKDGEFYINTSTKMTFIDQLGNEFKMRPANVKKGQWSPYESGTVFNNPEYHMKELEKIALSKGGKIKEGELYINSNTKMKFIDQLGNEFNMTPKAVKIGQWSPYEKNCSEHICRQIIEQIFGKEFPSSWNLITREGKRALQLDGYNSELKIGFEYQGYQHFFGWANNKEKQKDSLIQIQVRDNEKKQICLEKSILLLEINYYKNLKNIKEIIQSTISDVKKSYKVNNKNIPDFINNLQLDQIKIDLSKISLLVLMQKELEKIVLAKEGKIKEGEYYINSNAKMTFIDKLGNEFKMTPSNIKTGYWSPFESGNVYNNPEYHMQELQKIALTRGGKIKDGEFYISNSTKMTFIDKFGNEFKMSPSNIKTGYWSPFESNKIYSNPDYHIQELQKIALEREGKIKDGEVYISNSTKMTFIDKLNNEFKMTPNSVKRGQWSPYESGTVRDPEYHMQELQKIALARGGKIKEGEFYVNTSTKMTFIDKIGNEFKMKPNAVKNGSWSPFEYQKSLNDISINETIELSITKKIKL